MNSHAQRVGLIRLLPRMGKASHDMNTHNARLRYAPLLRNAELFVALET